MDPRSLDVLDQARDEDALAIGDGIDVDLDALEVAIDPDRTVRIDDGRSRKLAGEVARRVAEVDGKAADHERRAHDDRVTDPLCDRQRLLHAVRHPAFRLRDAEPIQQCREAGPFLGLIDRFEAGAKERDAAGRQRRREVEWRLATVGDDRRDEFAALGRLGIDDTADAFGVERLEVQTRRRIEVGRHGLRVRIDHDRAPAGASEGVGGLDRAVVELDPLPDPDGPGTDDQGRRAADRRRLRGGAGSRVGRIEVRRLRRELGGAGVDHGVAGPQAEGEAGGADLVLRRSGQVGQLPVPETGALDRGE